MRVTSVAVRLRPSRIASHRPSKLVNDGQTFELAAVVRLVIDKVVAPDVVGILRPVHPLCRHAKELAFTALLHHLLSPRGGELIGRVHG